METEGVAGEDLCTGTGNTMGKGGHVGARVLRAGNEVPNAPHLCCPSLPCRDLR